MRWNACVHRLDLGLFPHPKKCVCVWGGGGGGEGNGVRTHVNSKGKIPSIGTIAFRGGSNPRRCIKQDSEPNTLPTSYSGPAKSDDRSLCPPLSRQTLYRWATEAAKTWASVKNTVTLCEKTKQKQNNKNINNKKQTNKQTQRSKNLIIEIIAHIRNGHGRVDPEHCT